MIYINGEPAPEFPIKGPWSATTIAAHGPNGEDVIIRVMPRSGFNTNMFDMDADITTEPSNVAFQFQGQIFGGQHGFSYEWRYGGNQNYSTPSEPSKPKTRLEKLQALADDERAFPGERQAAREAIKRLMGA